MQASEYIVSIEKVAKYPHSNEQNIGALMYCGLGLTGEPAEIAEKLDDLGSKVGLTANDPVPANKVDALLKELGDVLWYVCRTAHELKADVQEFPDTSYMFEKNFDDKYPSMGEHTIGSLTAASLRIISTTGAVSDMLKKVLRDDNCLFTDDVPEDKNPNIVVKLYETLDHIDCAARELGSTIEEVAKMNIDKLFDRYDRNMLGGSGDYR